MDMAAVCTYPYGIAVLREHKTLFHIFQKLQITLFMLFFNFSNSFK